MTTPYQLEYLFVGYGLARMDSVPRGRVTSYSSYGGRHDPLSKNCFGHWCQSPSGRKLKLWLKKESAEKHRGEGEQVIEVYQDDNALRRQLIQLFNSDTQALREVYERMAALQGKQIPLKVAEG